VRTITLWDPSQASGDSPRSGTWVLFATFKGVYMPWLPPPPQPSGDPPFPKATAPSLPLKSLQAICAYAITRPQDLRCGLSRHFFEESV
jgi:hypothetical protein